MVSTLGFDTSHLYSLLVDEGVEAGDHLVLVRPDDGDSRGDDAVHEVREMTRKIDDTISVELVEVEPGKFESAAVELGGLLDDVDDDVVVNLAGGDRMLMLALAVAAMSSSAELRSVHVRSDVTRESRCVDLPSLEAGLDDSQREVLSYVLDNGPVSNTDIAAANGLSESSVSRCVRDLERRGFVEVDDAGGSNSVDAGFLGLLVDGGR